MSMRWFAALGVLAATTALSAPGSRTIAVMPDGDTELINLAQGMADVVEDRLSEGGHETLSRADLDPILAELALQKKAELFATEAEPVIRGAEYLVIVTMTKAEPARYLVGTRILQSAGGEVMRTWTVLASEADLHAVARALGDSVAMALAHLVSRAAPAGTIDNPTAETLLLQGIAEFHDGRIEESIRDFWGALQMQPALPLARRWLGEAYRAAGDTDLAAAIEGAGKER